MNDYRLLEDQDLGALASPFRRQLLQELKGEPDSAANIARRHDMSRQRVGYHMRELVKAGFLEIVEERQQRGLKEQLYRVRSFAYVHTNRPTAASKVQDRFSWVSLFNLLARGLWELVRVRKLADQQDKRVATLAMEVDIRFTSPEQRKAFTQALISAVEDLTDKYATADKNGRDFKLILGAYPSVKGEEDDER